jgi:hypothetical protein
MHQHASIMEHAHVQSIRHVGCAMHACIAARRAVMRWAHAWSTARHASSRAEDPECIRSHGWPRGGPCTAACMRRAAHSSMHAEGRAPLQRGLVEELAQQHAVRHVLEHRLVARIVLESDAVPDLAAQPHIHLLRHSRRDTHRSDAPRLRAPDHACTRDLGRSNPPVTSGGRTCAAPRGALGAHPPCQSRPRAGTVGAGWSCRRRFRRR